MAEDLRHVGIHRPQDLIGKNAYKLYDELCKKTGVKHGPCVIDVFLSVVDFMNGGDAKPWWKFTAERKVHDRTVKSPQRPHSHLRRNDEIAKNRVVKAKESMNKAVEATKQTAADMTDAAQEAGNHAVEATKKMEHDAVEVTKNAAHAVKEKMK